MPNTNHPCIQEKILQDHNVKLGQLETQADFKQQTILELKEDMEKMDKKLDKVLEGFNEFKLQSNKDDSQLELRLKAIETELDLQKEATKNNRQQQQAEMQKIVTWGGIVSIILVVFDLLLKYVIK